MGMRDSHGKAVGMRDSHGNAHFDRIFFLKYGFHNYSTN